MAKGLAGKRVAIGSSRKTEDISRLIEKQGGTFLLLLVPENERMGAMIIELSRYYAR